MSCECCAGEPDYRGHRIAVNINRYVKGKMAPDGNWASYHAAFRELQTTARGLAVEIYRGYSFCPLYEGERRRKENFRAAYHIALDFDTEDERSSLDYLAQQELIRWFASFGYTTPSHTPEAPKARIVWVFEEPITDRDVYRELGLALLHNFPWADQSTKDPVRLFYGSPDCEVWTNWSVFPRMAWKPVVEGYKDSLPPPDPDPNVVFDIPDSNGHYTRYVESAVQSECEQVETAMEGEKHDTRYVSACSLGELVAAEWADLSWQDAFDSLMRSAMKNTTLPRDRIELTVRDGLNRGMESPRPLPSREVAVR